MNSHSLFVFEADALPAFINSVDDVVHLIERLRREEDENPDLPPNLRFARLGKRLAQELPDVEENLWLRRPDAALSRCRKVWQPELRKTARIEWLLKVLLPLAKELRLGVFDARFGIYIPAEDQRMPMPNQEGMDYRIELDRGSVKVVPASEENPFGHITMSGMIRAVQRDEP
jgi:hypothetical protein